MIATEFYTLSSTIALLSILPIAPPVPWAEPNAGRNIVSILQYCFDSILNPINGLEPSIFTLMRNKKPQGVVRGQSFSFQLFSSIISRNGRSATVIIIYPEGYIIGDDDTIRTLAQLVHAFSLS